MNKTWTESVTYSYNSTVYPHLTEEDISADDALAKLGDMDIEDSPEEESDEVIEVPEEGEEVIEVPEEGEEGDEVIEVPEDTDEVIEVPEEGEESDEVIEVPEEGEEIEEPVVDEESTSAYQNLFELYEADSVKELYVELCDLPVSDVMKFILEATQVLEPERVENLVDRMTNLD